MIGESLISIMRLVTYHTAVEAESRKASREARQKVKTLQRDVASLSDHTRSEDRPARHRLVNP